MASLLISLEILPDAHVKATDIDPCYSAHGKLLFSVSIRDNQFVISSVESSGTGSLCPDLFGRDNRATEIGEMLDLIRMHVSADLYPIAHKAHVSIKKDAGVTRQLLERTSLGAGKDVLTETIFMDRLALGLRNLLRLYHLSAFESTFDRPPLYPVS